MTSKVDEATATQDGEKDLASSQTSEKPQATSPSTEAPQKKAKETEANILSDRKAEEGRVLKALRGELDVVKATLQKKEDEELAQVAKSIGKSSDEVKAIGLTSADKVKEYADFFGTAQKNDKPTFKADSGLSEGGSSEMPKSAQGKMQAGWREIHK